MIQIIRQLADPNSPTLFLFGSFGLQYSDNSDYII